MDEIQPIRILEVCQRMEAAGVQALLMSIYRNIDRSKVQMDFLVHYNEKNIYDEEIESLGGKIYRFPVREDYNFIKYIFQLRNFFSEHPEYKIIHGHMDSLGALYLHEAKKAGVPIRIAHAHNAAVQNGLKKYIRLFMIHRYKKYANKLFACSKVAGDFMFGHTEFKIINNAIDAEKFEFNETIRTQKREELYIQDKVVVGNVGRFHVQKNQVFLIEVLKECVKNNKDVILLLIGSGELETDLKTVIKKNGLEHNVIILNNRSDVNELYQSMDVYVMPSLYEGLPVSAMEAQCSGLPCVFSDTITKEVDISGNIKFIPLELGPEEWANTILDLALTHNRKNVKQTIVDAGYDAKNEAISWQNQYMDYVKELRER